MGHRLPYGLGGRGHCVDMLGVGEGKVNEMASPHRGQEILCYTHPQRALSLFVSTIRNDSRHIHKS
jgi:hypothetical protein